MSLLLVVRHGHAAGNAEHRFIGQSDVPLDDLGVAQARALCQRLAIQPIRRIISSDLRRATDTVAALAESLGIPLEVDSRLREIDNGAWTGLLPEEIARGWPGLWDSYVNGEDVHRPGGETWHAVRARAVDAVTELVGEQGLVLLCTHGGPALNLARWAVGIPPGGNVFRGSLGTLMNTSITTIEPSVPRLVGFNDIGHLAGLAEVRYPFEFVPQP